MSHKWDWCSQLEDGNFRIYFNYFGKRVYKVSKISVSSNRKSVINNHLFKYSSIISYQARSHQTIIEERFIKGPMLSLDKKSLRELISKLFLDDSDFKLSVFSYSEFVQKLEGNWRQIFLGLPVSQFDALIGGYVHGDLIPQNIILDKTGVFTIIDWEYSGFGLGLYDLWYLLYDFEGRRDHKSPSIISAIGSLITRKGLVVNEKQLYENVELCWNVWLARRNN